MTPAGRAPHARSLLSRTWKVAALLVVTSLGATQYMAERSRPAAAPRFSATAGLRAPVEPEVTGSLGPAAAQVRLDPCAAPRRP
ncbi:hypothetical protein OPKNFCMD_6321 [Methylobacterium crusticola]|uniref:Uncharacterized protein n=1 Tax=Methylobacterium crusticola TaxID=1697972 RepID=A0ABQ4R8W0_9HYPH|nr:hypothetical protein [Methylobacterium crusticola]GJD53544.1 hypothetical protein OPKNFCMD_6321 [Methylobacterium crusticola]